MTNSSQSITDEGLTEPQKKMLKLMEEAARDGKRLVISTHKQCGRSFVARKFLAIREAYLSLNEERR